MQEARVRLEHNTRGPTMARGENFFSSAHVGPTLVHQTRPVDMFKKIKDNIYAYIRACEYQVWHTQRQRMHDLLLAPPQGAGGGPGSSALFLLPRGRVRGARQGRTKRAERESRENTWFEINPVRVMKSCTGN